MHGLSWLRLVHMNDSKSGLGSARMYIRDPIRYFLHGASVCAIFGIVGDRESIGILA